MLILGTLITAWIVHNWWKILLLLAGLIALHEYRLYKKRIEGDGPAGSKEDSAAGSAEDTDLAKAADAAADEEAGE